jgi:hypothetical protein
LPEKQLPIFSKKYLDRISRVHLIHYLLKRLSRNNFIFYFDLRDLNRNFKGGLNISFSVIWRLASFTGGGRRSVSKLESLFDEQIEPAAVRGK